MEVDSVAGAARRQRERRLRQFLRRERLSDPMALAEFVHHSAPRGQRMARAGGGEEEEREENEQSEAPRRQSTMYFRMDEGVGRRFCWNQALDVLVLQMMEVVDVSQERGALRDVAVLSERVSERTVDMHVPQERELQRTLEQMPSRGVQLVPQERELQRAPSNAQRILHVRPDFELPQDVGAPARHGPMAPLERASERIEGREAAPTAISGVVRTSSTLV